MLIGPRTCIYMYIYIHIYIILTHCKNEYIQNIQMGIFYFKVSKLHVNLLVMYATAADKLLLNDASTMLRLRRINNASSQLATNEPLPGKLLLRFPFRYRNRRVTVQLSRACYAPSQCFYINLFFFVYRISLCPLLLYSCYIALPSPGNLAQSIIDRLINKYMIAWGFDCECVCVCVGVWVGV